MPRIIEQTDITLEFADLARRVPIARSVGQDGFLVVPGRGEGWHLSGVLTLIARAMGKLKPGQKFEEDMPGHVAMGFAVEEFIASLYPDWAWQPGEMVKDKIHMNCDGISPTVGLVNVVRAAPPFMLEEVKCTAKKARDGQDFLDEWYWMGQGQGYLHGYDLVDPALKVGWARWHVLYYRGNYEDFGMIYRRYLVEFTEKEVRRNWKMILNNRDDAEKEGD